MNCESRKTLTDSSTSSIQRVVSRQLRGYEERITDNGEPKKLHATFFVLGWIAERLSGNQVQKMQDKRILGTVGRTLLIAKSS